jgi:hypothetical protein
MEVGGSLALGMATIALSLSVGARTKARLAIDHPSLHRPYDQQPAVLIIRRYCDFPTTSGCLVWPNPTFDSELKVSSLSENFNRNVTINGVS